MLKKGWQSDKQLEKLSLKKVFLFNLYIAVFTIFFGIASLIPVLFLRFQASRKYYWTSLSILFLGLSVLSPVSLIILIAIVLSVESFFFLENYSFSLFLNILFASMLATSFLYFSFFLFQDYAFFTQLLPKLEPLKQQFLKNITPEVFEKLLIQLPSFIVTSFSFLLFFSLRLLSFFKSPYTLSSAKKVDLSLFNTKSYLLALKKKSFNFSVSSWVVWVFILALILSFVQLPLPEIFKTIGLNILNICFGFYFLQGLGIITEVLSLLKAKKITKVLIYILSFVYLFSFISIFGFFDYWFNFRKKIKIYKIINKKTL